MTDGVRVAREALQAIIADVGTSTLAHKKANRALVALEAVDATRAERDEKIRAEAAYYLSQRLPASAYDPAEGAMERILALLALGPTTKNGVCVKCGSAVLNGEHLRDDLPPCMGASVPTTEEET